MKNKKFILSGLICIALTLSCIFSVIGFRNSTVAHATDTHQAHNDITFGEWNSNNSLPTDAGDYYLTQDITLTDTWTVPKGETNLCLNGHVISINGYRVENNAIVGVNIDKDIIKISSGAILNVHDCNTITHKFTEFVGEDDETLWILDDNLEGSDIKHTVQGGVITGAYTTNGNCSGICINGGEFTLNGGNVAGIYTNAIDAYEGNITINGGSICGNAGSGVITQSANIVMNDGKISYNFGGTWAMSGAMIITESNFTMNGGLISHNQSVQFSAGINCMASTVTMNDGEISNNIAYPIQYCGAGGGVYIFQGQFIMNDGKIYDNEAYSGGAVFVGEYSSFIMNDGEISGNKATQSGGAVCLAGVNGDKYAGLFAMHGGSITNNTASVSGGGVSVQYGYTFKADGGIISNNICSDIVASGAGVYFEYDENDDVIETCLAAGTPIAVSDGSGGHTYKNIEELDGTVDKLYVFNHESGELVEADIFDLWMFPYKKYGAFTLHFTDGNTTPDEIDVTAVGGHCFFEKEANKYINITNDNVEDFIGKEFYNAVEAKWYTLESVTHIDEAVDTYILVSKTYLNTLANGMLSNVDGLYTVLCNIFDFDTDLKYDAVQKELDISTYGTWDYDDDHFHYVNEDTYNAINLQYLSVAIGKGLLTLEELQAAAERTLQYNPIVVRDDVFNAFGIFLGGTIQIKDNKVEILEKPDDLEPYAVINNNVHMYNGGLKITLGTGIIGNGVKAPEAGMMVGITAMDTTTHDYTDYAFTTNGTGKDLEYFFADSEKCAIVLNDNGTSKDPDDDYLEHCMYYEISNSFTEEDKDTNNGYIEVSTDKARLNEKVTITVNVNDGYYLVEDSLKVTYNDFDGNKHEVTITAGKNNTYTFDMPYFDVTIEAEFEEDVYYLFVGDDTYVLNKNPNPTDSSFEEYCNRRIEIAAGDTISIARTADGANKFAVTNSGLENIISKINDNYICETGGFYAFHLKLKSGSDTLLVADAAAENKITKVLIDNWTYGEDANTPTVTATYGQATATYTYSNQESGEYTTTVPTEAGRYWIKATIAETDEYLGAEKKVQFSVDKRAIEMIWVEKDFTYNGDDFTSEITVSYKTLDGKVHPIDSDYIQIKNNKYIVGSDRSGYASYDFIEAGSYTANLTTAGWKAVIAEAGSNYKQPGSAGRTHVYTIAKAALTITAKSKTIKYNEDPANDGVIYGDFVNNETISVLGGTLTYTYTYEKGDDAGTYDITPSGLTSDNYDITFVKGTLTVDKIAIDKPVEDTTNFVYTGSALTYTVAANDLYEVTNNVQTNAGNYKVVIKLKDKDNYTWKDGTTTDLEYDFAVAKIALTITAKNKTIKYNEDPANDGVSYEGFINNETASVLGGTLAYVYTYTKGDNAGTYDITPSGLTSDNYDITFVKGTLTVEKIAVDKPALDTTNFVYTGSALTYTVAANDLYEVTNNVQTNAGTYTVKVALKDKTNYAWKDGTTTDIEYGFVIEKVKVNEPTVTGTYVFNGNAQTVALNGVESYMATTSSLTQTNAGVYTITYTLDGNHEWASGNDGILTWEIKASTINPTGRDTKQGDVIVESSEGFSNDITVTVEVVAEVEVEEKELTVDYYNIVNEQIKLIGNETVGVVYDVRLIQTINGQSREIQPSDIKEGTTIKVKMLIPETVDINKVTRILHVHSANDIESIAFDQSKVDADGYYEIEVNRLSEFAFIYEKEASSIWWIIIIILILLLLIIYLLGYFFLYRKGKLDDRKIRIIYKFLPKPDTEEEVDEETTIGQGPTAKTEETKEESMAKEEEVKEESEAKEEAKEDNIEQ